MAHTPQTPQQRILWKNLRAKITGPYRRLTVEHVAGTTQRLTCRSCGHSWTTTLTVPGGKAAMTEAMCKKLTAYQNQSKDGIGGFCPKCTKAARDAMYPLK